MRAYGLFTVMVFLAAATVHAEETASVSESVYVTTATVKSWQEEGKGVFFLDVRGADEFEAGHLPGAKNIVWTEAVSLGERGRFIKGHVIHDP